MGISFRENLSGMRLVSRFDDRVKNLENRMAKKKNQQ